MSEMGPEALALLQARIRAEVQANPATYSGKSAAEIAALMSAPVVVAAPAAHRDVSISDVEGYLRARLILAQLRPWTEAAPAGTAKLAALELLDIIASPRLSRFTTSTDTGRANILGLFAVLVAATGGIVTQQHYDDLAAMTVDPAGAPVTRHPRWVDVMLSLPPEAAAGLPNEVTPEMIAEALA